MLLANLNNKLGTFLPKGESKKELSKQCPSFKIGTVVVTKFKCQPAKEDAEVGKTEGECEKIQALSKSRMGI